MRTDNVVNQLRDQYRFANAGTTKQPRFSATFKWGKQVNMFDTGCEYRGRLGSPLQ